MLFAGLGSVLIVKNCDLGLENAAFSRPRSQFFTIRADSKPANNMSIFFFDSKLVLQITIQMGLFTQLLSLNRLARRLLTICKKFWQRASNLDSRQRKMY